LKIKGDPAKRVSVGKGEADPEIERGHRSNKNASSQARGWGEKK